MKRKKPRYWSPEELNILRREYPVLGGRGLEKILNRDKQQISIKASALGIKVVFNESRHGHNFIGYKNVSGNFLKIIRQSAKNRNLQFELTAEFIYNLWLKQDKKCFYSGREISFSPKTASVDRIDSTRGYTVDNVTLVHKMVNIIKMSKTHDEFLSLIHKIRNVINTKEK